MPQTSALWKISAHDGCQSFKIQIAVSCGYFWWVFVGEIIGFKLGWVFGETFLFFTKSSGTLLGSQSLQTVAQGTLDALLKASENVGFKPWALSMPISKDAQHCGSSLCAILSGIV